MAGDGTVQIGVGSGSNFAVLVDGETIKLSPLAQIPGYGFPLDAQTQNLDVGDEAMIDFQAFDPSHAEVDYEPTPQTIKFAPIGDTCELGGGYVVPIDPTLDPDLDGQLVTITLEVTDHDGHQATDQHTVIAQLPN
jgi:hypothetical protein